MSNSPTPNPGTTSTLYTPSSGEPYAELIQILRSVHGRAERDRSLHPNDRAADELERSLRQQIDSLASSRDADAA